MSRLHHALFNGHTARATRAVCRVELGSLGDGKRLRSAPDREPRSSPSTIPSPSNAVRLSSPSSVGQGGGGGATILDGRVALWQPSPRWKRPMAAALGAVASAGASLSPTTPSAACVSLVTPRAIPPAASTLLQFVLTTLCQVGSAICCVDLGASPPRPWAALVSVARFAAANAAVYHPGKV